VCDGDQHKPRGRRPSAARERRWPKRR